MYLFSVYLYLTPTSSLSVTSYLFFHIKLLKMSCVHTHIRKNLLQSAHKIWATATHHTQQIPFTIRLTPPLLLHASLALLLPPLGLLHLLVLATLVEVLHHHTNKHVEDKEADDEEEGDEIQQHPGVVVGHRLEMVWWWVETEEKQQRENLRLLIKAICHFYLDNLK